MLDSLSCECEAVKHQMKMQLEQLEMQLHRSHRQEVNDLENKSENLQVELDEARLSDKQLKQKLGSLGGTSLSQILKASTTI